MKTTDLKKLQGTARADRMKEGIDFELVSELPKPETWLDRKAKQYFVNTAQMLIDKKLLFVSDVHLVSMLAQEMAIYEKACRELKKKDGYVMKTKNDYEQQSPWVGIRSTALKNVKELSSLFGLDPLSREKFGGQTKPNEPSNPFEKL